MSEPVFSVDWTTHKIEAWQSLLGHLTDQPARMLEIGVWEGRSSIHFCQQFLTHTDSRLVCLDPHPQPAFLSNLKAAGVRWRVEFHQSDSRRHLAAFSDQQFDAAYIDGSHEAADVLRDGLNVLPLMKPGGIIIFDDYSHSNLPGRYLLPHVGIDGFMQVCSPHYVEEIARDWQLTVRVLPAASPWPGRNRATAVTQKKTKPDNPEIEEST